MTVTRKPDRRGEYDISRKTIARGMPGVSRCDLTNACAFYHYRCTRGYRAHRTPGIPCALCLQRAERTGQTSRETRGEIAKLYLVVIASEAKQSILSFLLHDGLLRFARNDGLKDRATTF